MGYDAGSYEGIDAQRKEYMYKKLIAARPDWANRVDLMYDASQVELEYYRGINDGSIPDANLSMVTKTDPSGSVSAATFGIRFDANGDVDAFTVDGVDL